jgi:hypothetical protein
MPKYESKASIKMHSFSINRKFFININSPEVLFKSIFLKEFIDKNQRITGIEDNLCKMV